MNTYLVRIIPAVVFTVTKPVLVNTIRGGIAISKARIMLQRTIGHWAPDFIGIVPAIGVCVASNQSRNTLSIVTSEILILRTSTFYLISRVATIVHSITSCIHGHTFFIQTFQPAERTSAVAAVTGFFVGTIGAMGDSIAR